MRLPNLLWICLEDVSPWFGCYGQRVVATPHIDQLAARGLCFERCFSPAPVCSPARSALITGRPPASIGVHQHRSSRTPFDPVLLPVGVRTVPERLIEAGYLCFNSGKDDYNFRYERTALYPGPFRSGFHHQEGPPVPWDQLESMQPFFGQIQLDGGKAKRDPGVRALRPDSRQVVIPPGYPDDSVFLDSFALHYACIRAMDSAVGEIMARLEAAAFNRPTVVVLFSDHGMDGLRHKQFCYDGGLHVPLIMAELDGEGRIPAGTRRRELVDSRVIAATTLALAGAPTTPIEAFEDMLGGGYRAAEAVFGGRDRCDFTLDGIRTVRTDRFRYIRNYYPERAWLQPQYRSVWPEFLRWHELAKAGCLSGAAADFAGATRPAEELYAVDEDPHLVHNQAGDPVHAVELQRHRDLLAAHLHESGDAIAAGFTECDLLATLVRWKDECVDPSYRMVREKHANTIARFPEQRPWRRGDPASLQA